MTRSVFIWAVRQPAAAVAMVGCSLSLGAAHSRLRRLTLPALPQILMLLVVSLLTVGGCRNNGNGGGADTFQSAPLQKDQAPADMADLAKDGAMRPQTGTLAATPIAPKLIRNGSVSFQTSDITRSQQVVKEMLRRIGGYLADENQYTNDSRHTYHMTVRIPSATFDTFLVMLEQHAGVFDSRQISTNDVGEEYADVQARIRNRKELLDRYRTLLSKATKIDDVLQLERSINDIQTEIEAAEGRIRYFDNRVSYSTLNIEIYRKVMGPNRFLYRIREGFKGGFDLMQWLIIGLVHLWPLWLVVAGLWWWRRKRRA